MEFVKQRRRGNSFKQDIGHLNTLLKVKSDEGIKEHPYIIQSDDD